MAKVPYFSYLSKKINLHLKAPSLSWLGFVASIPARSEKQKLKPASKRIVWSQLNNLLASTVSRVVSRLGVSEN